MSCSRQRQRSAETALPAVLNEPSSQSLLGRIRALAVGYDFFISYSRGNSPDKPGDLPRGEARSYVRYLAQRLQQDGYLCYLDVEDLPAGEMIKKQVFGAVNASRGFVAICSKDADRYVDGDNEYSGWVKLEVTQFQAHFRPTARPVLLLQRIAVIALKWISRLRRNGSADRPPVLAIGFGESEAARLDWDDLYDRVGVNRPPGDDLPRGIQDTRSNFLRGEPSDNVLRELKARAKWRRALVVARVAFGTVLAAAIILPSLWKIDADATALARMVEDASFKTSAHDLVREFDGPVGWIAAQRFRAKVLQRMDEQDFNSLAKATATGLQIVLLRDARAPQVSMLRNPAWKGLGQSVEPTLRVQLLHDLSNNVNDFPALVDMLDRLFKDAGSDPYLRQALIMILGQAAQSNSAISADKGLRDLLLQYFETDPSPGVHSAIRWTLLRMNENEVRDIELAWATQWKEKFAAEIRGDSNARGWLVMPLFPGLDGQARFDPRSIITFVTISRQQPNGNRIRSAICATEVTVWQWKRSGQKVRKEGVDEADEVHDGVTSDAPVSGILPKDAEVFCKGLETIELAPSHVCEFRLPEVDEWLSREGLIDIRRPFFGVNAEFLDCFGHFAAKRLESKNAQFVFKPQAVGSLKPSPNGFFDVIGNVAEICISRTECRDRPRETAMFRSLGWSVNDKRPRIDVLLTTLANGGDCVGATGIVQNGFRIAFDLPPYTAP